MAVAAGAGPWTPTYGGSGSIELTHDGLMVDPAHVLAECAAKRAIVEKAQRADEAFGRQINPATSAASFALTEVLCRLAAPYADHPDYDPAWKVEP